MLSLTIFCKTRNKKNVMFHSFKQHPLYLRKEQCSRIRIKYPNRIPVILEKYHNATNAPDIDKAKFLVPGDTTVGSFMHVIRKRVHLSDQTALFLYVNTSLAPTSELMSIVYERYKDPDDGFLYMCYATENTFGKYN